MASIAPCILLSGLLAWAGTAYAAKFPTISVQVDGREVPISEQGVAIPSDFHTLRFGIAETDWLDKPKDDARFRFKLEGYEQDWQVRNSSDMGLKVHLENDQGDRITDKYFYVSGESPGWSGHFGTSPLLRKHETLIVPPECSRVSLSITSAGPPEAIGVYLVSDLTLFLQKRNQSIAQIFKSSGQVGPDGIWEPKGWTKEGTRPSMCKVVPPQELAHSDFGLAVVDEDPLAHAEWHLPSEYLPPVEPGDRLFLEWNTMYSTGQAGAVAAMYPRLHAGNYRFLVNVLDAMGNPQEMRGLSLRVYTPLRLQPWLWVVVSILLLIGAGFIGRMIVRANVEKQLERVRQAHAVESERLRIARDIHDDLGARLTHISLVSGGASAHAHSLEDAKDIFDKISFMTRDLVSALYETVWTVDPKNDNLEALVNHISQLVENLCSSSSMAYRIRVGELRDGHAVSSDVRHHIILIVKEAVNNAVKYSQGSELSVEINQGSLLEIKIRDNGSGFDVETASGNGLKNLQWRARAIGGMLDIQSSPAHGTAVIFTVKI